VQPTFDPYFIEAVLAPIARMGIRSSLFWTGIEISSKLALGSMSRGIKRANEIEPNT
jgi:hypothetical protein